MSYYVQAEIVNGVSHWISWWDCDELLKLKDYDSVEVWPQTILKDKKGLDGKDLRTIAEDALGLAYSERFKQLCI